MAFNTGGAAQGALGGAVAGGVIGGPIGAGIGGLAGGLLGGFGGGPSGPKIPHFDSQYDEYGRLKSSFGNRPTPQVGWRGNTFRDYQGTLARMLADEARGRGIGQQVVRQQAQQMGDRALLQALAASQGAGPGGNAMAARNAALAGASAQSQIGGQASLAGGQLALGAQQQLGGLAGQARGQDLGAAFGNANLEMQNRQLNQEGILEALRQRQALSMGAAAPVQPGMGQQLMAFGAGMAPLGLMKGQPQGSGGQVGPGYYDPNQGQGYRYGG